MKGLFNAAPDGIIAVDRNGHVVQVNPKAETLFGYRSEELHALTLADLVPERFRQAHSAHHARYFEAPRARPMGTSASDVMGRRKDGTEFPAEISLSFLDADEGGLTFAFVRDMTEKRRMEAQLRDALQMSEIFVGILGHDLRTPLNAIVGSADLLAVSTDEEANGASIRRIRRAASRMTKMVEQLLDLTRIRRAGGLPLEKKVVDIASLCRNIIDELIAETTQGADERLQLHASGKTDGCWDGERLAQLLSNLVSNALHHGAPDQPITVDVDGTSADRVILRVQNQGVIPDGIFPTVFDAFRGTREDGRGLGLGLYIAKQIVQAHGGTIRATSSVADGTVFEVALPREELARDDGSGPKLRPLEKTGPHRLDPTGAKRPGKDIPDR